MAAQSDILTCQVYCKRLVDPALDLEVKCVIVTDMRDLIELLPPAEQPRYFEIIIPTFISVLSSTQPVFTNASHEHKLRNAVLEVIHRLQTNHALLPFAVQLMDIIMAILRSDNEDNGAICLKILVELHKNFRSVLEDHVQLFFELVKDMYQSMDSVVKEIFDVETIGQTPGSTHTATPISPAPDDSAPKNLARSTKSFKVLTECPIILAMLFQVYKRFVPTHIPEFVPITIGALSLQPEAQRRSHEEATRDGRIFIGVSPYIPHRLRVQYSELKALQVKTLSFIAYILRSFTALLKPYENQIATCVVDLLKDCPPEACQTRKDILVATRHIGYTEFRAPFVQYMDVLLNEEVIIGTGLTGRDGIRSLGHSVLVDLIHHVRMELTPTQVSRAIHLYSRNLHDPTLAPGIHTVCAKLLFNLMDRIMPMHATEEKETGRILLLRIFTAIATKFPSLSSTLPMIIRTHYRRKTQAGQPPTLEKKGNEYEFDGFLDLGVVQPIRTTGKALEQSADVIKDVRFLFKNMVGGIKNILGNMISFNPPPPANFDGAEWNRVARGFSEEENKIFVTILIHGLKCFDLLYVENFNPDGSRIPISDKGAASNGASVVTKEEKELYEGFGLIFHYVEPSIFQEVFSSQMEYFIEQILQNNALIGIAQYFLNNPAVSASFTGLLLRYLVDKMEVLGGVDTVRANVLLRLFKLVFHAVGSLPKENELVLRPHVAHIILTSLKLSAKAVEPMNYFVVLRALFRSIGGGRFELLYGEVFPLLQLLLESLNALLASAHKPQMREIFCELCLTVPVRLSVLLPYLSYLMKPVVHALHSGPELVLQGLRTLEVCIENLTQEFLEPILAPVLCDLMAALWKHLKPLPYDPKISHNTMRILGKLGGRNRRLLRDPPLLSYQANIEAGLDLEMFLYTAPQQRGSGDAGKTGVATTATRANGSAVSPVSGASLLSLDACLNVAVCIVNEPTSGVAKCREALNFLYAALPLLIHPGCEYENARVPRGVIRRMREKIRAQVAERERVSVHAVTNGSSGGPGRETPGVGTSGLGDELDSRKNLTAEESQSRNMTPNPSVAIGVGAVASQDDEAQIFVDALPFTHEWKEAHDKALGKVIEGLFATALLAELRDESWRTIEDLCCHFAIFCTAETAKGKVQSRSDAILFSWGTNGEGFINGVVEAMTCEWAERRALGQRALRYFHSCCRAILGSDVLVQELSVFRIFMSRFCSTCYRSESFRKIGGCLGIRLICSELGMGQKWLLEHEHECARALLYVLKDSGTSELMDENTDDASETLLFLLRVCNEPLEPIVRKSDIAMDFSSNPAPSGLNGMEVDGPDMEDPKEDQVGNKDGTDDAMDVDPDSLKREDLQVDMSEKTHTEAAEMEDKNEDDGNVDMEDVGQSVVRSSGEKSGDDEQGISTDQTNEATGLRVTPIRANAGEPPERVQRFNGLVSLLVVELNNCNANVRLAVQKASKLLAELHGITITDLLNPVKARMLGPIFAKPLRALPFSNQIGNIDAITYSLSLQPALVQFNDELLRLLHEALALADADDQALVSKNSQFKNQTSLTQLRVVCIKLLSAAMTTPEFFSQKQPTQQATRSRIISMFFKSLYSKSPEIVEEANKGLQRVLSTQSKLPKDLLQQGLRPILVKLSDHKLLSVSGLEGLARLMELLTNYFKPEIGKKLLDHLRQWADPNMLEEAAGRLLSDIEDIKIIVAIIDVFYLLPAAASTFMDELVREVVKLESKLKRSISSPFRTPLVRFLTRYPAESIEYFTGKLGDVEGVPFVRLLVDLLEFADGLRIEMKQRLGGMLDHLLTDNDSPNVTWIISIVHVLARDDREWLRSDVVVFERMWNLWKAKLDQMSTIDLSVIGLSPPTNDSQRLIEILIWYSSSEPINADVVFDIVRGINHPDVIDPGFIKQFLFENVGKNLSATNKRLVIERFLAIFHDFKIPQETKAQILKLVITPMLLLAVEQGTHHLIVDSKLVEMVHLRVWHPMLGDHADVLVSDEGLRLELLQLTTLLVQYFPEAISESRKDVIKFAWGSLKTEEVTCKQAAYVLLCRFVAAFETPNKLIMQMLGKLFTFQMGDTKMLVRQALDILVPVLPERTAVAGKDVRTGSTGPGASTPAAPNKPMWVRWFRRALVEDGQNSMQMIPIFQCLVNHSNVFYEYRDQFISHIITSLHRLPAMSSSSSTGSSMSSVPEWKTLTVELGELILSWETRQATEASAMVKSDNVEDRLEPPAKRAMLESPDGTTYADTQTPFRERLVSYVVRFAISTHEPQTKRLVERSIDLVRSFLELWPELNIEMDAFERVITMEVNEGTIPTISSSIDILRVIGAAKSNEWVVANCGIIQRFVSKWIESEDSRMSKTVVPICDRVMGAAAAVPLANFSQEIQMDIKGFTDMVEAVAKAGLSEPARLYTSVLLLECINLHRPQSSESLIVMLELIKRLANEYLHPEEQIPQHDAAYNELLPPMLIKLMNMSKNRVAAMNDHRRGYLAVVAVLIEEANDVELLECLATLVRGWIFSKHEAFPTIKEKANVMLKMVTFDRLKEKRLLEEYLILVADVYSDPGFHRTELAVRLENAFLMGLAAENPHLRDRFSQLLDRSLSPVVGLRLNYLIGVQNWEPLADSFWLRQATNLLIGSIVPTETLHSTAKGYRVTAVTLDTQNGMDENLASECDVVEEPEKDVDDILARHGEFLQHLQTQGIPSLLQPIKSMMYSDTSLTYRVWVNMFPVCWSVLNADERHQIVNKSIIPLLAKDYHKKQLDSSLNVIQALLEGIANCVPAIKLPPQLVKYLGRSYNSWHVALELISAASGPDRHVATPQSKEDEKITQMTLDALADVYVSLGENDYFFGLWRRRSLYQETNAGISYAQTGMWAQAQTMFENAQAKARTGALPFSEAEYSLWESQWISCAQRLQQWDVLTDLAKHDGNTELLVECAWRIGDWEAERESLISSLASVSEVPTPRKKVFEAFLALGSGSDTNFEKAVHDGIQLSLKRWIALPTYVMNAHIPLLHFFQQFLELTEAATIRANVIVTDHSNVETKQTELKNILQTWRDRLPNSWDDINIWSDLVAWRQHIFAIINKAYLPMIKMISQQAPNNPNSSFAYRGYHETAWIINRFAHIARKHQLPEVCSNMLSNIYKLPNIEIQEAFFKLREQAKSHFQNPNEYAHGLDVINNTNLMYFTNAQKAEFFSLKGRFLAKLDIHQEAFKQLSSAVQVEMTLPKAWAALARYYDRMFKEQPTDFTNGANAINAYLNAAGLTNHARCRKYIARILFLLSMDYKDQISNSYEKYRGEVPQWYWVTFIPQLLTSLASKEAKFARAILMKMAKNYPQALHFSLRTARAELEILKRHMQMQMIQARAEISSNSSLRGGSGNSDATANGNSGTTCSAQEDAESSVIPQPSSVATPVMGALSSAIPTAHTPTTASAPEVATTAAPSTPGATDSDGSGSQAVVGGSEHSLNGLAASQSPRAQASSGSTDSNGQSGNPISPAGLAAASAAAQAPSQRSHPLMHVEEVMSLVKTAFPLLALSLETMADQLTERFKPLPDEDIYRLIVALLADGILQLDRQSPENMHNQLSQATEQNLLRFAQSMSNNHRRYKASFEREFIKPKPTLFQLVEKFREWRDKLEILLDRRPRRQNLEHFSHYLVEFEYQKFDEIEIPGQYSLMKDLQSQKDFIRIDRFLQPVDLVRGYGNRRITMKGHDGSLHPFVIHHPSVRVCRREEKVMQLFRILNTVLDRKKESRRRNLFFHLPVIVPLAPNVRLIQDDPSYVTLQEMYEDFCRRSGLNKDEPTTYHLTRMREIIASEEMPRRSQNRTDIANAKAEILQTIQEKMIPPTILSQFIARRMESYSDLWVFRKQFSGQLAAVTFLTHTMCIGQRLPQKFNISCRTGNIWASEVVPFLLATGFLFQNKESVPFRLTPNLSHFITETGMEGPFASSILAIARSVTEPEYDLEDFLSLFVRDELVAWQQGSRKPATLTEQQTRELIAQNVNVLLQRAQGLSCRTEREKGTESTLPANQTILDLIANATNPLKLAQMELAFLAAL